MLSIQRAGMWKRISAAMFDGILLGIAVVLFALILSWALGYDGYIDTLTSVTINMAHSTAWTFICHWMSMIS